MIIAPTGCLPAVTGAVRLVDIIHLPIVEEKSILQTVNCKLSNKKRRSFDRRFLLAYYFMEMAFLAFSAMTSGVRP